MTMITPFDPISDVREHGYTRGDFRTVFDAALLRGVEWTKLLDSWNNLKLDQYMADGGTYRQRRYSEFLYEADANSLALLSHVPYSQSREINRLNGGVERHYEPFESHVVDNDVLQAVLQWCINTMTNIVGPSSWRAQTFQNRILARGDETGQPAPEGVHRDGVDYVLTLVMGRSEVEGGVSGIHDPESHDSRAEVLLSSPGEFLFADDEKILHSVTPLRPTSSDREGYRDTLIAMFTRTDGVVRP